MVGSICGDNEQRKGQGCSRGVVQGAGRGHFWRAVQQLCCLDVLSPYCSCAHTAWALLWGLEQPLKGLEQPLKGFLPRISVSRVEDAHTGGLSELLSVSQVCKRIFTCPCPAALGDWMENYSVQRSSGEGLGYFKESHLLIRVEIC